MFPAVGSDFNRESENSLRTHIGEVKKEPTTDLAPEEAIIYLRSHPNGISYTPTAYYAISPKTPSA